MPASRNYRWRVAATGICFASFGMGSLLLSLFIAPVVWLIPARSQWKRDAIHFIIYRSSRIFVRMLRSFGILTLTVEGGERLREGSGHLVVANHPSLIDVVLLNSLIRNTGCIVKNAVWYNPFMSGVARAAGYVSNTDPQRTLQECSALLQSGRSLIVFPEGTRTTPGEPVRFRRGAANMALSAAKAITPVAIVLRPSTLTRDKTWYDIPADGPFHVTLTIGSDIPIEPFLDSHRWLAARELTAVLQGHFQHLAQDT